MGIFNLFVDFEYALNEKQNESPATIGEIHVRHPTFHAGLGLLMPSLLGPFLALQNPHQIIWPRNRKKNQVEMRVRLGRLG